MARNMVRLSTSILGSFFIPIELSYLLGAPLGSANPLDQVAYHQDRGVAVGR
jgi:hypothetical protein